MQLAAVRKTSSVEKSQAFSYEEETDRIFGPGRKLLQEVKTGEIRDLFSLYESGIISGLAFRDTINWGLKETRGDCKKLKDLLRVSRMTDDQFREYLAQHCSVICPDEYRQIPER